MESIEYKLDVTWRENPFFCGLDVHKHELAVAICSAEYRIAKIVKTAIFSMTNKGLEQFWNFVKKYRPAGFAMEATGIYHHNLFKFLKQKSYTVLWAFEIVVVNPADSNNLPGRQKNDKIDAESLAKYLAKGMLKSGKPVIEVYEDLKAIFRMMVRIEKDRTALKNRIKKTLDRAGIRPRVLNLNYDWVCNVLYYFSQFQGTLGAFLDEALLEDHPLSPHHHIIKKNMNTFEPYFHNSLTSVQRALIRQDLIELDFKTGRKATFTIEVGHVIEQYPTLRRDASNLASVPGFSKFTAVWILVEIGNIKQYSSAKKFAAYCGCCPRIVSSAGKVYSAHISRHSNTYLRTIFYKAAVVICNLLKQESDLKTYAIRTLKRKGKRAFKLAACNITTKLTKIVYAILRDGIPFNPNHSQNKSFSSKQGDFSIADKKVIRHARKVLLRVTRMESAHKLGITGTDIQSLAEELDGLLKGKKIK